MVNGNEETFEERRQTDEERMDDGGGGTRLKWTTLSDTDRQTDSAMVEL